MAEITLDSDVTLGGIGRIRGSLPALVGDGLVTLDQAEAMISRPAFKEPVRAASVANINLAAPGANIDGIAMVSGDRFLVKDQSAAAQNGLYNWNGAAVPATRTADASTWEELEAAVIIVEEGTQAGTQWRQTQVNGTLESSSVAFVSNSGSAPAASTTVAGVIEIATQGEADAGTAGLALTPETARAASWGVRKYTQTIGDGSATSFAVTHGLNNARPQVAVSLTSAPFDVVWCEVEFTSAAQVTVKTNSTPAAGAYTVCVQG